MTVRRRSHPIIYMCAVAVLAAGAATASACGGSRGRAPLVPPGDEDVGGPPLGTPDAGVAVAGKTWPVPAGFAASALVQVLGEELVFWSVAGDQLAETGRVHLGGELEDGWPSAAWADREHLFVELPPRTVLMVTEREIVEIAVPGAEKFVTPRPKVEDDEGLEAGGVMEGGTYGLVVVEGEAWWSECPWGYPYDGWQCEVYVSERLWPRPQRREQPGPIQPRAWAWPRAEPAGYGLKVVGEAETELVCAPPAEKGKKAQRTVFKGDKAQDEWVMDQAWVATEPPRLLIVFGTPGLADLVASRWSLHDGCAPAALAQGEWVEPGPHGLWLASESANPGGEAPSSLHVRRGGADLGVVPGGGLVVFRP